MSTYDTIITNLQGIIDPVTGLPYFNNPSATALYKKIADALAPIIDNTLTEQTNTQTIIQGIINSQRYGRSGYYIAKALAYQYDNTTPQVLTPDPITLDPIYAVIDPTKQIITQCAFELSGSNTLILKVAKIDSGTGLLGPLSGTEKTDFDSYFLNFEIPGLPVQKISIAANVINFDVAIIYDPNYDLAALITSMQAAILTYRDVFPFNGYFYKNGIYGLENYLIANVTGLVDVTLSNMSNDSAAFSVYSKLAAGYFNYDGGITAKFADQGNYTPVS